MFAFCASNFEVSNSFFWGALAEENLGEALLNLSQNAIGFQRKLLSGIFREKKLL